MDISRSKPIFHILIFFAILASLLGSAVFVTPAYAAGITVNSSADTTADDGTCTLQEAVANANSDSQLYATSGECAAGSGSDTITFAPGLSGATITLASMLTLSSDMTIDGSALASQITVSGGGNVEVFSVSSGTVTLNSLKITNGSASAGGGIYNAGTLTVTNSTLSGNAATTGPGGGVKNDGILTVTNSTFSGNTAHASGGGIRNIGTLTVANSTFSDNSSATGSGGGIYNAATFVSITITNSTFSGNSAWSQGGGIFYAGGTLNYANTIIANSTTAGNPGGDCDGSGTIATNINNLVEDTSFSCSASLTGDPNLVSLTDNGGPTQTFALGLGSPAIDAGDNTVCDDNPGPNNLDQRGIARPQNGQCDIGAYETKFLTVTTSADPGDGTCDASCSLNDAIASAGSGDIINFYTALSGTTIHLASPLTLAKNVTIDGSALAGQITISGDGNVQVFSVNSGTVTLNSLTITNGSTNTSIGGGILNNSGATLTVTNSTISGNTTGGPGGGIKNDGTLTVIDSTFSNNSAGLSGGGIRNAGTLTVANSTFSGNSAGGSGGGIYNTGSYILTITNSTFSGNGAASQGGGIYYDGGTLNYANTIIANSTSGGDCNGGNGGVIGVNTNNLVEDNTCSPSLHVDPNLGSLADNGPSTGSGQATMTFALLTGSPAIDAGDSTTCTNSPVSNLDQRGVTRPQGAQCDIGAYEYQYQSTVTKLADTNDGVCDSDCSLREAIATAVSYQTIIFDSSLSGGTIHLGSTLNVDQNMTIDGSALASKITVSGDSDSNGTADVRVFYIHSGMTVTIDSLVITKGNGTAPNDEDNLTTGGGGIQNNSGNTGGVVLTVKNSVISGNSADNGGGINNRDQSTMTITNSAISGNTASGDGGGILSNGTLTVTSSTISGNSAAGDGGGIRDGSTTALTNSTISGNSASGSGGGIFNAGNLTAKNNTLSGNSASASNGGGFYGNNAFSATNNIIANSVSGGDCAGEIDGNVNNLVEDNTCSPSLHGDPGLDVLADNGGPTQTMALTIGSSAIDAGDDGACTSSPVSSLDQRGVTRPVGAHCDIGAYEGAKDITAPTVTAFSATSPSTSLNIPISSFTASDNVAVTGYKITETATPPAAGASGWTASAPSSYTVGGSGSYTLYPWAKDAAGNVSAVYGSPASVSVDSNTPSVTAFTVPSSSTSLNVPITTFTASDNAAVTGYIVTGSSTPPLVSAAGWTASAPTTYTIGSDGSYTLYPWAKDAAGNVSAVYGSPASVSVDTIAPAISSITRITASPSAKASVQFLVTFSEAVTSITTADFSLTSTVTGASIASVSGSATTRTVTVNTGSGNGAIRLDIPNTATITDLAGNALSGLPFTGGETYTINKTLTFTSTASQDGWILESSETSNIGGALNTTATTFRLGDEAADKQYRSILSFNTTSLPDNATITGVTLKIKRPTTGFLTGDNNPFTWGLGLKVDVCKSMFGTSNALQLSDFNYNNAANCKLLAAAFGSTPSANWYSANVLSAAFAKINLAGLTQFRLRFAKDDNDDGQADYLSFYSGNVTATSRPQLVITYSVP